MPDFETPGSSSSSFHHTDLQDDAALRQPIYQLAHASMARVPALPCKRGFQFQKRHRNEPWYIRDNSEVRQDHRGWLRLPTQQPYVAPLTLQASRDAPLPWYPVVVRPTMCLAAPRAREFSRAGVLAASYRPFSFLPLTLRHFDTQAPVPRSRSGW